VVEPLGSALMDHNVYELDWQGIHVFAAADTAGVFVYDGGSTGSHEWRNIGLRGVRCREIAVSPTDPDHILVGTLPHGDDGTVIYRTTDGGITWVASDDGIPREQRISARAFPSKARLRFHPSDPSLAVATQIAYPPYITTDGGATWTMLGDEQIESSTINDVVWSTQYPGVMFAGGESFALTPVLFRSTDAGETWTYVLDIDISELGGEHAIDGFAISHADPDVIIAGTEGYVIRSTNLGDNWEKVIDERLPYYVMSPLWDHFEGDRAFAVGGNALPGGTGGVFVSNDRGKTWDTIVRDRWCTVERGITTPAFPNSVIFSSARPSDFPDQDTLPRGVYIVRPSTPSGIGDENPDSQRTLSLLLNPSHQAVRLSVPVPHARAECTITLYDILGRPLAAPKSLTSGSITFDNLPSGVVLYIIQHNNKILARGKAVIN
jgi:photosystem II stability/assembly factor-like uncharacterized protein